MRVQSAIVNMLPSGAAVTSRRAPVNGADPTRALHSAAGINATWGTTDRETTEASRFRALIDRHWSVSVCLQWITRNSWIYWEWWAVWGMKLTLNSPRVSRASLKRLWQSCVVLLISESGLLKTRATFESVTRAPKHLLHLRRVNFSMKPVLTKCRWCSVIQILARITLIDLTSQLWGFDFVLRRLNCHWKCLWEILHETTTISYFKVQKSA